jgi:hypothetical protein
MPFQAHDDGSVSRAFAPRPIIQANHSNARFGVARLRPPFEVAQDCIVAGGHPDALHQSFTRPPADAMAKEMNDFSRPNRAARRRGRYTLQLPGERLPLASLVTTLPALNAKLHGHSRALRRQILQMTFMPAVPVQRLPPAVRADAGPVAHRRNHPLAMNLFRTENLYSGLRGPS